MADWTGIAVTIVAVGPLYVNAVVKVLIVREIGRNNAAIRGPEALHMADEILAAVTRHSELLCEAMKRRR